MIALLHNHHYNGQLSTTKLLSTFEHYKNSTIIEWRERTRWDLLLSLSHLSLSKGSYSFPISDLGFRGCVWTTRLNIFVQENGKSRFHHLNRGFHCHLRGGNPSLVDLASTNMISQISYSFSYCFPFEAIPNLPFESYIEANKRNGFRWVSKSTSQNQT